MDNTRRRSATVRLLAGATLLFAAISGAMGQVARDVTFSGGTGVVAVPPGYEASFSKEGGLQLLETSGRNVRVYIDFHALNAANQPANVGEAFVRALAKRKRLGVEELGDRVVMVERGKTTEVDGKPVANVHRVIGFGKSYAVLTTTIQEDQLASPQARRFLETHLEPMIRSLKRGNGKQ